MQARYHRSITHQALNDRFSPAALDEIVRANLGLDNLFGQVGHDEYHFDQNAFRKSLDFIELNRSRVRPALEAGDGPSAWRSLGRLTHTAQDFYAHSNYVALWLERYAQAGPSDPVSIDPLDAVLLADSALHSGKLYYPLEVFSFIPVIKEWVMPFLPRDSHAWMNLDGPEREPLFSYAFHAASKRTRHEYEKTIDGLSPDLIALLSS